MFKKIVSIILSAVMIFTALFCVAPISFATEKGIDTPLIYVQGQGEAIYKNYGTPEQKQVYPVQLPEGFIEEKADILLPVFAKAFFTQQWDEFCEVLAEIIIPVFSEVRLDNNGEASDGSRISWDWSPETLYDKKNNGKYQIEDYVFEYDWRLDPWEIADELHEYIKCVKEVTGAEKVSILGRCLGSNIVAAYMTKYNGEYIDEVIFYASASHGAAMASKAFCGELFLESDGIERYVYDIQLFEEDYLQQLIQSLVTLLNDTYGLDVACWAVNNVYKDIYLNIVPPIMSETFATFPGYWSMVTEGDFEKAKDVVFYNSQPGEFDGLISKIDNYHINTRLKMDDKYIELHNEGVEFSNITKYGYEIIPVSKDNHVISDGTCEIGQSSMGVTSSEITGTLSDEYIANAVKNGTDKYISPDKQLDASTCLFPDSTWFIKNLEHKNFPDDINYIFAEIINKDNFTVFDNPEYTQYLVYDDESDSISPMTEENCNTTERWNVSFFEALKMFFESMISIIKNSLSSVS